MNSPEDALKTFAKSGIDQLMMGPFLVGKKAARNGARRCESALSGLAIPLLVRQRMAGLPLGAEVVPPTRADSVAT